MVDNKGTVDGAYSDRISKEARFNGMRLAFIREQAMNGIVRIKSIRTGANIADVFTKPLSPKLHNQFRDIIMGHANHSETFN